MCLVHLCLLNAELLLVHAINLKSWVQRSEGLIWTQGTHQFRYGQYLWPSSCIAKLQLWEVSRTHFTTWNHAPWIVIMQYGTHFKLERKLRRLHRRLFEMEFCWFTALLIGLSGKLTLNIRHAWYKVPRTGVKVTSQSLCGCHYVAQFVTLSNVKS